MQKFLQWLEAKRDVWDLKWPYQQEPYALDDAGEERFNRAYAQADRRGQDPFTAAHKASRRIDASLRHNFPVTLTNKQELTRALQYNPETVRHLLYNDYLMIQDYFNEHPANLAFIIQAAYQGEIPDFVAQDLDQNSLIRLRRLVAGQAGVHDFVWRQGH